MTQTKHDRKPTNLFFAGTDTDVGKTFTASLVAKRYCQLGLGKIGVYKPVASGCRRENGGLVAEDAVQLWEAAGRPRTLEDVCPQRFEAPLAPTQAAQLENQVVDKAMLRDGAKCWEDDCDLLIIEGAGGLMSPLADGLLNIDLANQFENVRLVIVAANRLGVIHQVLATCAAARHARIQPAGIFLCQVDREPDRSVESNAIEIANYTDVPILGSVTHDMTVDRFSIADPILS